jgi:L-ribulose-5-phosphate 4-epimerase
MELQHWLQAGQEVNLAQPHHGLLTFTWGKSADDSVDNAVVLEMVARLDLLTFSIKLQQVPIPDYLLDKHCLRKHAYGAYYGQCDAASSPI